MSDDRRTSTRIMAHMIPYFPNLEASRAAFEGLVAGGVTYLEIQFPFSDPSADGPVIQSACAQALREGFTVAKGFEFVAEACRRCEAPVFVMTYAGIPVAHGVERFVDRVAACGATGIIAPDLPPDYDEGLYRAGESAGVSVVPVLAPSVGTYRIDLVRELAPTFVYAALRAGITGQETSLGAENLAFLERLSPIGAKVLAGFGVRRREQVAVLEEHVDAVVVGSHFVRAIAEAAGGGPQAVRAAARWAVAVLAGRDEVGVS